MEDKKLNEILEKTCASLTDEQKEKVKDCKDVNEFISALGEMGVALPDELLEASSIDGAGPFRSFLWIVLPVCRPVLGAAAALSFAESWNLVEQPLTYLSKSVTLMPLSTRFNQMMAGTKGYEFAGAALYILPALLIYLFFQEDILAGIQLTEMK